MTGRGVRIFAIGFAAVTLTLAVASVIIAITTPAFESPIYEQFGIGPAVVFGVVAVSFAVVGVIITITFFRIAWISGVSSTARR